MSTAILLSEREKQWVFEYVKMYSDTLEGTWLLNVDYKSLTYEWSIIDQVIEDLDPGWFKTVLDWFLGGIMGAFEWTSKTLKIRWSTAGLTTGNPDHDQFHILTMMPTVIHELWHYRQFCRNPIVYVLGHMAHVRQRVLEDSADRQTELAEKFFATVKQPGIK